MQLILAHYFSNKFLPLNNIIVVWLSKTHHTLIVHKDLENWGQLVQYTVEKSSLWQSATNLSSGCPVEATAPQDNKELEC